MEPSSSSSEAKEDRLREAIIEARDLYIGYSVAEIRSEDIEPLAFFRDYVALSRPCVIKGIARDWPALTKWRTNEYLSEKLKDQPISVAFTPNGRADAVHVDEKTGQSWFVIPETRQITFDEFVQKLRDSEGGSEVPYCQLQNDSLRTEFDSLRSDVPDHIPFASRAFGKLPEVVNMWIGNSKSSTSFHKDHYENVYCVISGRKHFSLLPPHEGHRLHMQSFPTASFKCSEEGAYDIVPDGHSVKWSALDLEAEKNREGDFQRYFDSSWPKVLECTVEAGDLLYLPACWHHYVSQSCDDEGRCIAVNYWYDMTFGPSYLGNRLAGIVL